MFNLGTKDNPIQFNLHSIEDLDELCSICEKMGLAFEAYNDLSQPEDILEFDYLLARQLMDFKKVKIGRNDSCPCGSQKKLKKCCIERICKVCGEIHSDEIEYNHPNPLS